MDSRVRLRGLVPASRPARRVCLPGAECVADETHGSAWGEGSRPGGSHKLLSCLRLSFLINFAWQMSLSFPEPSQVRSISLSAVGLTDPVTSGWRRTQDIGGENVGILCALKTPAWTPCSWLPVGPWQAPQRRRRRRSGWAVQGQLQTDGRPPGHPRAHPR